MSLLVYLIMPDTRLLRKTFMMPLKPLYYLLGKGGYVFGSVG